MAKLVIENTVKVPVKFDVNNKGKGKSFNFNLICDRLPQDELSAIMKDDSALTVDVMTRVTKGWENQTLVIDDDNQPVDFSAENFEVMLSLPGIQNVAWLSYLKEVGAKTKN